jgi:hypothetical protein
MDTSEEVDFNEAVYQAAGSGGNPACRRIDRSSG